MLVDLYVEALLTNPDLADQVWELSNVGLVSDELAAWAWLLIGATGIRTIRVALDQVSVAGDLAF